MECPFCLSRERPCKGPANVLNSVECSKNEGMCSKDEGMYGDDGPRCGPQAALCRARCGPAQARQRASDSDPFGH
jgi:hypothetical protein